MRSVVKSTRVRDHFDVCPRRLSRRVDAALGQERRQVVGFSVFVLDRILIARVDLPDRFVDREFPLRDTPVHDGRIALLYLAALEHAREETIGVAILREYHHTAGLAIETVGQVDVGAEVGPQTCDQRVDDVDAARVHGNVSRLRDGEIVVVFEEYVVAVVDGRLGVQNGVRDGVVFAVRRGRRPRRRRSRAPTGRARASSSRRRCDTESGGPGTRRSTSPIETSRRGR